MAEPKKEVMSNKVYLQLREMAAHYRFQPGARINVEMLSRELGVSRTPVWEAIRRLEQEGLVENIPNRGVFMVEMTLEEGLDIYQVRQVLDTLAGRLAAGHMDQRSLKKMARCLQDQLAIVRKGDLVRYSQLDYEFHYCIYERCRNSFLQEILDSLKLKMQPLNVRIMPILVGLYQDHVEIFKGLRTGDADRVEKAFRTHNERLLKQIEEDIEIAVQLREETRKLRETPIDGYRFGGPRRS